MDEIRRLAPGTVQDEGYPPVAAELPLATPLSTLDDDVLAARPPRTRTMPTGWRQVALIGTMSIFGPLCIDMYLPALPDINRELHASASAVQLTLTACLIGIAAGQLILGPISDRYGRRPPLLAGLAAFVLSSLACAVAPNIYFLTGFRLIQGLGGAAGIVIARSIVRDLHSGWPWPGSSPR